MRVELVGDELRQARKRAKLTQDALGDLLGISGSAVGQWETGATRPAWKQAARLREILLPAEPADAPVSRAEFTRLQQQVAGLAARLGLALDEMDVDEPPSHEATPAAPDVGRSPQ